MALIRYFLLPSHAEVSTLNSLPFPIAAGPKDTCRKHTHTINTYGFFIPLNVHLLGVPDRSAAPLWYKYSSRQNLAWPGFVAAVASLPASYWNSCGGASSPHHTHHLQADMATSFLLLPYSFHTHATLDTSLQEWWLAHSSYQAVRACSSPWSSISAVNVGGSEGQKGWRKVSMKAVDILIEVLKVHVSIILLSGWMTQSVRMNSVSSCRQLGFCLFVYIYWTCTQTFESSAESRLHVNLFGGLQWSY